MIVIMVRSVELVEVEVRPSEPELLVTHPGRYCWDLVHFVVLVKAVVYLWQLVLEIAVPFGKDWPWLVCWDSHPNRKLNLVAKVAVDLAVLECTNKNQIQFTSI